MAFWITLMRGILAVALGVALVFQSDKARPILGNFMGMFWLVSGIMSLRWGLQGERARGLPLLAGVIGVLAGLGMLARNLVGGLAAEAIIISILGLIILLTGVIHIAGGFTQGQGFTSQGGGRFREKLRKWPWTAVALGIFEIILGLLLIINPLEQGEGVYNAASIWR